MNRKTAPILLYHGVREGTDDAIRDPLYGVPAHVLAVQLGWLRENGFRTLALDRLLSFGDGGERACAVTVDDCLRSAYTHILPALGERGFTAVFFAIAGTIGKPGWVGWGELREMARSGMEIGSHGLTHTNLASLPVSMIRRELVDSRKRIEDGVGERVRYLSLPGGYRREGVESLAAEAGYEAVCGSRWGYVTEGSGSYFLSRFCMKAGDGIPLLGDIMKRSGPHLLWRTRRERFREFARRAMGDAAYRRLRGWLIPAGTPRELPCFPADG
ncbi:MAG: polysaccharide deacetylase family protein [Candidatus Aureabacteria bacterium]|nr:polysaccharide deacetylase family protein [Candidatus Auribacterota bacterium]